MAPLQRPVAEPSTSQTSTGNVTNKIGQALIGAIAIADATPATNAMAARRQPKASTTAWARRAMVTAGARQPRSPPAWTRLYCRRRRRAQWDWSPRLRLHRAGAVRVVVRAVPSGG